MSKESCHRYITKIKRVTHPWCEKCGSPEYSPHHIFGRNSNSTAFIPMYVVSLCGRCHDNFNIPRFKEWLIEQRGYGWYLDGWSIAHNKIIPDKEMDFNALRVELRAILAAEINRRMVA